VAVEESYKMEGEAEEIEGGEVEKQVIIYKRLLNSLLPQKA